MLCSVMITWPGEPAAWRANSLLQRQAFSAQVCEEEILRNNLCLSEPESQEQLCYVQLCLNGSES